MPYKIVGTKDYQTVRSERQSLLIAAAKARVWSREGWDVVVTDSEGKTLDPAGFDELFAPRPVKQLEEQPVEQPEEQSA